MGADLQGRLDSLSKRFVQVGQRNIARRVAALDKWVQANLQPFEQVVTIDDVPCVVDSESSRNPYLAHLALVAIVPLAFVVPQVRFIVLPVAAAAVTAATILPTQRHYVAVTDPRVFVQRVSTRKAASSKGPVQQYPRRSVRVIGYKRAKKSSESSTLTVAIAEPSGAERKLKLSVSAVVFPGRAEAIKQALEQQGS